MAHSVHQNFTSFHQVNHRPKINSGIVLKINANARYTSDAITCSYLKSVAEKSQIPLQEFIVPANSRCGSTVGPMISSNLGCLAVDIGAP
jgi:aspartyl aminopeptidase